MVWNVRVGETHLCRFGRTANVPTVEQSVDLPTGQGRAQLNPRSVKRWAGSTYSGPIHPWAKKRTTTRTASNPKMSRNAAVDSASTRAPAKLAENLSQPAGSMLVIGPNRSGALSIYDSGSWGQTTI